jgi:hypothetical protein
MSDRFDEDLLDDPTGELRKGLSALEEFEGAEDFETADEFEEAMTNGLEAADTDAFFGGLEIFRALELVRGARTLAEFAGRIVQQVFVKSIAHRYSPGDRASSPVRFAAKMMSPRPWRRDGSVSRTQARC